MPIPAITDMLPCREHAAPLTAAATLRQLVIIESPDRDAIASLGFSCNLFGSSFDEPISLSGLYPIAGLDHIADADRGHPRLRACLTTTPATRISRCAAASVVLDDVR
jgi:hypothetical protein